MKIIAYPLAVEGADSVVLKLTDKHSSLQPFTDVWLLLGYVDADGAFTYVGQSDGSWAGIRMQDGRNATPRLPSDPRIDGADGYHGVLWTTNQLSGPNDVGDFHATLYASTTPPGKLRLDVHDCTPRAQAAPGKPQAAAAAAAKPKPPPQKPQAAAAARPKPPQKPQAAAAARPAAQKRRLESRAFTAHDFIEGGEAAAIICDTSSRDVAVTGGAFERTSAPPTPTTGIFRRSAAPFRLSADTEATSMMDGTMCERPWVLISRQDAAPFGGLVLQPAYRSQLVCVRVIMRTDNGRCCNLQCNIQDLCEVFYDDSGSRLPILEDSGVFIPLSATAGAPVVQAALIIVSWKHWNGNEWVLHVPGKKTASRKGAARRDWGNGPTLNVTVTKPATRTPHELDQHYDANAFVYACDGPHATPKLIPPTPMSGPGEPAQPDNLAAFRDQLIARDQAARQRAQGR